MTAHKPPTRLSRSLTLTLLTGLTLAAGRPASAQTGIEPLDTLPPGLGGNDFLVDLSSVANAEGTLTFPAEYVKVRNIPFRIARPGQGGHLFLKPIGWSDWETDPSG